MPRTLTNAEKGVLLAVMAHLVWGGMAVYFGLIRHISPVEIAVNRGLWSLPIAAAHRLVSGPVAAMSGAPSPRRAISPSSRSPRASSCSTGASMSGRSRQGRTLESSLGYFINPLLNVVMGYLFLGERFTTPQMVALALATVAVLIQTVALGHVPVARPDAGRHLLPLWLPAEDHSRGPHPGLPHRSRDHRAAACWRAVLAVSRTAQAHFGSTRFDTADADGLRRDDGCRR